MKQTYDEAMTQVFADEGGYSNDPADSGGPTKYGITIADVRKYLKPNATAQDVQALTKAQAETIYRKHYADPVNYDGLPAGVDYSVLDYGINAGVSRALKVYNSVKTSDPKATINAIYDERERFYRNIVKSKPSQNVFMNGWMARTGRGRKLALSMVDKYKPATTAHTVGTTVAITSGVTAAAATPHKYWPAIAVGVILAIMVGFVTVEIMKRKKQNVEDNQSQDQSVMARVVD